MLRNIDVDLLRSFVTVAELRSFTRAAAALFRSQSTVSTQIRRLEELAGQTLLQRSPQEVFLTRAGEQFHGYARRIVALHDEALDVINAQSVSGRVRLAVMDDYATIVCRRPWRALPARTRMSSWRSRQASRAIS